MAASCTIGSCCWICADSCRPSWTSCCWDTPQALTPRAISSARALYIRFMTVPPSLQSLCVHHPASSLPPPAHRSHPQRMPRNALHLGREGWRLQRETEPQQAAGNAENREHPHQREERASGIHEGHDERERSEEHTSE